MLILLALASENMPLTAIIALYKTYLYHGILILCYLLMSDEERIKNRFRLYAI